MKPFDDAGTIEAIQNAGDILALIQRKTAAP